MDLAMFCRRERRHDGFLRCESSEKRNPASRQGSQFQGFATPRPRAYAVPPHYAKSLLKRGDDLVANWLRSRVR